jgi:hypothetical protein
MTGQLCARPTGGRCTWSWRFSTQRSYPQAEHHLGCRGRQDDLLLDVPKQTGQRRMTILLRAGAASGQLLVVDAIDEKEAPREAHNRECFSTPSRGQLR